MKEIEKRRMQLYELNQDNLRNPPNNFPGTANKSLKFKSREEMMRQPGFSSNDLGITNIDDSFLCLHDKYSLIKHINYATLNRFLPPTNGRF